MSGAFIECEHSAKWYGQIIAVNDVSLSVASGVTGLLGPNGAGKSTLLKMMVGQLRPSKGTVKVLGESVWGNRPLMRRIGYCPEHEGTYEDLTGLEMVTAMTELHGFSRDEARARAEKMFGMVDLTEAMNRRLGEYSKGMRQRAKLAQALAHDPEVIFLDEPLTGCDPLARVRILEVINDLAARGRCVVVSSHVLHEIETMTSQILLMHKGQLRAEGDVHQIRALIDAHPHKVRVECDRPRALAERLVGQEHVVGVTVDGEALVIDTRMPDRLYPAIPEAARASGVYIRALTSPDDNMAAVFKYLTETATS
ncbi:MAG: yxlF 4 [Myxococcales bacterium]|nr:yxlF 4 [Myxococcales bacterium]